MVKVKTGLVTGVEFDHALLLRDIVHEWLTKRAITTK